METKDLKQNTKMTKRKLNKIIKNHKKWLNNEKGGVIADLFQQDLTDANLSGCDLRYADLRYAELTNADLSGSNLSFAKLRGAHLTNADLTYSNLYGANLYGADLCFADFRFADLRWSNLCACKTDNIIHNEYTSFFALQCPEDGAFVGYKKVNNVIVKLEIPEDAKRSCGTSKNAVAPRQKFWDFMI